MILSSAGKVGSSQDSISCAMNDILRSFRLGIINVLGVILPGLMFLFLLFFGCLMPVVLLLGNVQSDITLDHLPPLGRIPDSAAVLIAAVLAYVIGYIFRLSTPDDLDKKSAALVIAKMKVEKGSETAAADDHWPYREESDNKFPYFYFKDYLEHREHHDLARHVKWNEKVRSKTFVNEMKLETALRCPQLASIIDSNEAHIRLLFGTWLACLHSRKFIIAGLVLSACSMALESGLLICSASAHHFPTSSLIWLLITLGLYRGSESAIVRIESLFHYRRVREIFDIVTCYHLACQGFDASGRPKEPEGGDRRQTRKVLTDRRKKKPGVGF